MPQAQPTIPAGEDCPSWMEEFSDREASPPPLFRKQSGAFSKNKSECPITDTTTKHPLLLLLLVVV
jgi:hypothetical protein